MIVIIAGFILISLMLATVYFYLYNKEKEKFILYWGLSWILYSVGLVCLVGHFAGLDSSLLLIKKALGMTSMLFLLYSAYTFCHRRTPGFWGRFNIYLCIWALIAIYVNIDQLSAAIPIALFDLLLVGCTAWVIIKNWEVDFVEKNAICIVITLWGVLEAFVACYEGASHIENMLYFGEILYVNLLNVAVITMYSLQSRVDLSRVEAQYKLIVDNAVDAIFYFILKPETFRYITPSIEEVTGYTPQYFYDNPRFLQGIVAKDDIEKVRAIFYSAMNTIAPTSEVFRIVKKNGEIAWLSLNVSVIKDDDGNPIAIDGAFRDISVMKNTQEQLVSSKQSRDLLFSYVSHELKTPITSILGYVQAINGGYLSDKNDVDNAMRVVEQKATFLQRMILDIFQLSQLETNQYSFNFALMTCEELATDIGEAIHPLLKDSGIHYKLQLSGEKFDENILVADTVRITQVITNLVTNAIKYTKVRNEISIKCELAANKFVITVSDKGIGISKEDLQHIFERFYKASDSRIKTSERSGLGLALSKEIIAAHDGEIIAKSKLGKGSKFVVALPLYEE